MSKFFFVLLFFTWINSSQEEIFSAVAELTGFLHGKLTPFLDEYGKHPIEKSEEAEDTRMRLVALANTFKNNEEGEKLISDPLTGYLVLKEIARKWEKLQTEILRDGIDDLKLMAQELSAVVPSVEDFEGARTAILRLQEIYEVNASSVVSSHNQPLLTAQDCYEIGIDAYNNKQYTHAAEWMVEAWHILQQEERKTVQNSMLLKYLAYSHFYEISLAAAFQLMLGAFGLMPIDNLNSLLRPPKRKSSYDLEQQAYNYICSDRFNSDDSQSGQFTCYYDSSNGHAFLILQPVKLEIVSKAPYVVRYHDILSNNEMTIIKTLAAPKLKRARVYGKTGQPEIASYRLSKGAQVQSTDHRIVGSLLARLDAATGLNRDSFEPLSVVNYGLGGFYDTHYDASHGPRNWKNQTDAMGYNGRRIATVLLYLSDVELGGATVFPDVGLRILPIKGSAVFWYNLKRSGEGDVLTAHSGCPVMYGSKWVANYWIRDIGQEFRRPCSLKRKE